MNNAEIRMILSQSGRDSGHTFKPAPYFSGGAQTFAFFIRNTKEQASKAHTLHAWKGFHANSVIENQML